MADAAVDEESAAAAVDEVAAECGVSTSRLAPRSPQAVTTFKPMTESIVDALRINPPGWR